MALDTYLMPLTRPQRLEAPIVEDQELDAAEGAHQPGIAAVAAGQVDDVVLDRVLVEEAGDLHVVEELPELEQWDPSPEDEAALRAGRLDLEAALRVWRA